jgi:hypothetical protein
MEDQPSLTKRVILSRKKWDIAISHAGKRALEAERALVNLGVAMGKINIDFNKFR